MAIAGAAVVIGQDVIRDHWSVLIAVARWACCVNPALASTLGAA